MEATLSRKVFSHSRTFLLTSSSGGSLIRYFSCIARAPVIVRLLVCFVTSPNIWGKFRRKSCPSRISKRVLLNAVLISA